MIGFSSFVFPQKLTNITLDFNINKIYPKTKSLINQTIENFHSIYSDNCRIYIRPSGTELVKLLVGQKSENWFFITITNRLI